MIECLTAQQIIEKASRIIPLESQNESVLDIASIISLHLKRLKAIELGTEVDDLPTISQLIIASTGSGKTYLISQLAKAAGIGFYTIDASSITPSGYKGTNLSQAIYSIKSSAETTRKFETSIILFDEFDKLAYGRAGYSEEYNCQPNFLTLLESKKFAYTDSNGYTHKMDTSKILFLFAGAFQGLDEIIKKRVSTRKSIGFYASDKKQDNDSSNYLSRAAMEDLERYGFNRELLGRIGSIHYIPSLTRQDYVVLLRDGEHSVQGKYAKLLSVNKAGFSITDEACEMIANQAIEKNLGARAANTIVMEKVLEAVHRVDEDKSITEVRLHADEKQLILEYSSETNRTEDTGTIEKANEISIAHYMETERGMNHLCQKMLDSYPRDEEDLEGEVITFYFLQLALRYIKICTNKTDRTLSSVEKLAKCSLHTEDEFSAENKTTFDIMIEDYMEKAENAEVYDFNMLLTKYLYQRYKALENVKSATQIVCAVSKMKEKWE